MRLMTLEVGLITLLSMSALAQTPQPGSEIQPEKPSLTVTSRAVVVDVIVTDSSGKPVTGLGRDAFTVTEQGKAQTISFFEENGVAAPAEAMEMPKLPPDVFSNFSPFPQPPAVNVLLLDSLNTRIEDQSVVHSEAMKFLKSAKPGTRTAIFTMGLALHFIQGFNDDPAVLAAALNNNKNNEVETSVMLKGQDETIAQQRVVDMMSASEGGHGATAASAEMIAALQRFTDENDTSRSFDRMFRTLANLQRLAAFLEGFPGRKNIIWFAEKVPGVFLTGGKTGNPAFDDEMERTLAMLATARAAIYPVDARGTSNSAQFTAENLPRSSQTAEDMDRNTDQMNAQQLAEQSGGRAFANMNGISEVIDKVTSNSAHFYTLSYVPTDAKMNAVFRKIGVKVVGGNYSLSYRRGYFAVDTDLPGSAMRIRDQEAQKLADQNPGAIDPLLPFMDLGMPQSEQILYKLRIVPVADANEPAEKKDKSHYKVDFAIDLKNLKLDLGADGLHKGTLNVSLIVFDRYGNIISREDHVAALNIKTDAYAVFQNTGVPLHVDLAVPKGNYWLRTGVYDEGSRQVGTMEIALSSVAPLQASSATKRTMESESAKILTPVSVTAPAAPVPATAAVLPVRDAEKITVEQLEDKLAAAHGKHDKDLAKQLGGMQLIERLNSQRLAKMQAGLPGEKSRQALLVLADASVFLHLPAAEIPATAEPDADAQKLILRKAGEYLAASIHKLPDFFAEKTTTRFHDLKVLELSEGAAPVVREHQPFQLLDSFSNGVSYRGGQEVDEANGKNQKTLPRPANGMVNWGVFGPLLRIAMTDISKGRAEWGHWEQRETGPVAVFSYSIPKAASTYTVKYCCYGTPNTGLRPFETVPPFHGEIAIDAATGAVYRLVLITELSPSDPIFQAATMVEYEPIEIGGRTYICPRKSVTVTTAITQIMHQGCWGKVGVTDDCSPIEVARPKDTSINDTEYHSYHVFGSEMRIVPEGNE